jgi:acyl-CoA reductase-like NAD-dependent aldehyde dehydrogenase
VTGTAAFFRYLGGLELSIKVIEDTPTRRVEAHGRPLGVTGAIIHWNYPLLLISLKASAALHSNRCPSTRAILRRLPPVAKKAQ